MVVALTLGILAPRASAIAMDLMPGTFQTVVICNGFEMTTITIDAEGNKVEIASDGHECVMKDAVAKATAPAPQWQRLARAHQLGTARSDLVRAPQPTALPPPAIGPPLTV